MGILPLVLLALLHAAYAQRYFDCLPNQFKCTSDDMCIDNSKLCDNRNDCTDKSDEVNTCSNIYCLSRLNCTETCIKSPFGGLCTCRQGYVYNNSKCVDFNECSTWGFCDQKCQNSPGSYSCTCHNGYTLQADKSTCLAASGGNLELMYGSNGTMKRIVRKGDNWEEKNKIDITNFLDFDYSMDRRGNKMYYWIIDKVRKIHFKTTSTSTQSFEFESIARPTMLVVDWISRNIYIFDARSQRIDLVYISPEGILNQANIVSEGVESVGAMAVDPLAGYLFFTDKGKTEKLERVNLDGSNRKVLVDNQIYAPIGLTLDIPNRRLIYGDSYFDFIKSLDYEGSNRRTIIQNHTIVPHMRQLTVFENKLFTLDATMLGIMQYERNNPIGSYKKIFSMTNHKLTGLKAVHKLSKPFPLVPHPCEKNSTCDHICVSLPPVKGQDYKCICKYGYQLTVDAANPKGKCVFIEDFLIVLKPKLIRGVALTGDNRTDAMVPIVGNASTTFTTMAFDAINEYIYYADSANNAIFRVKRDGTEKVYLNVTGLSQVDGLDLDWTNNNLYYADFGTGTIGVIRVENDENFAKRVTLIRNLTNVLELVVNPTDGHMYFSEIGRRGKISKALLNGSNVEDIIKTEIAIPRGLSIDYTNQKLFWCDSHFDWIKSSDFRGRSVTTMRSSGFTLPSSISVHNSSGIIYYSDYRRETVGKIPIKNPGNAEIILSGVKNVQQVKIYSKNLQPQTGSLCEKGNSNCEQFCYNLNQPRTYRHCGCEDGKKLEVKAGDKFICVNGSSVPEIKCPAGQFLCNNKRCIREQFVCDKDNDCFDNSDEDICVNRTCKSGMWRCANGQCINSRWRCDRETDCSDKSDEVNCPTNGTTCRPNTFRCDNGLCVSMADRCDSYNDCGDASDEANCNNITVFNCAAQPGRFKCAKSGRCIRTLYRCDGENDCLDGSDEPNSCSTRRCLETQFQCIRSKKCIARSYFCDGVRDCEDGSDEMCTTLPPGRCQSTEFMCKSTKTCIPLTWKCDGSSDCNDGSDESRELCPTPEPCPNGTFTCSNKKCIPGEGRCDRDDDCGDNSDEINCTGDKMRCVCPRRHYKCLDRPCSCIPYDKVCDGTTDCLNGIDEGPTCNNRTCYSEAHGCSFRCIDTPFGATCYCPRGFKLGSDYKTCIDIDECAVPGNCSQRCTNNNGGFKCSCDKGYTLTGEKNVKTFCKVNNPDEFRLYVSNRNAILELDMIKRRMRVLPIPRMELVTEIDFDSVEGRIYFGEGRKHKIYSAYPNGTDLQEVVGSGLGLVEGIALDWIGRNLYFVDYVMETIEVVSLDSSHRIVLFSENVKNPRGIALDPRSLAMKLFWSDWGRNPKIESSGLDGSGRKAIVTSGLFWPSGLTIDYPNRRLYFVDAKYDTIESVNYDGSQRTMVGGNTQFIRHPYGVSIFEDNIYWTDREANAVHKCNKFDCSNKTVLTQRVSAPIGLVAYHPVRQPQGVNHCARSGCSHSCLLSLNSPFYTCKCPIPLKLDADKKTCKTANDVAFVMLRSGEKITGFSFGATPTDQTPSPFIPVTHKTLGEDFDYDSDATVVWLKNLGTATAPAWAIYKSSMDGINSTEIISRTILNSPKCLAIDWISRNLYIGDNVTHTIEVVRMDNTTYHKTILRNNQVGKPNSIVLDPAKGKMYWLDTGYGPVPRKLAAANMDGSNPELLLPANGYSISNGRYLTMDRENQILYWSQASGANGEIWQYNLTSKVASRLRSDVHQPMGLDFYNNTVYYSSQTQETISALDTLKNTSKVIKNNLENIGAVKIFQAGRPQGQNNMCIQNNGGCPQLCLPTPSGHQCACAKGFKLDNNNNCQEVDSFLLVVQLKGISGLPLEDNTDVGLYIHNSSYSAFQASVDTYRQKLYWGDTGTSNPGIFTSDLQGQNVKRFLHKDVGSIAIRGVAVDWIAKNLYFTNAYPSDTKIEVCRFDGTQRTVLRHLRMTDPIPQQPRSVAVNPKRRYLYWADYGQHPKIVRANLDGSNMVPIVTENIKLPSDMSIDIDTGDIYWTDLLRDTLERTDWNGTNRKTIINSTMGLPKPAGVVFFKENLYVGDQNYKTVFKIPKDGAPRNQWQKLGSDLENVMDLVVYDKSVQPLSPDNPCATNNGGCEALCFALPGESKATCGCSTGTLQSDGSCKHPNEYIVYTTTSTLVGLDLLTGTRSKPFHSDATFSTAQAIAYNYNHNNIYVAQNNKRKISVFDITSGRVVDIMDNRNISSRDTTHSLGRVQSMAYDWIHHRLYWSDSLYMRIRSIDPDKVSANGTDRITVAVVYTPYAIALNPCKGELYWTRWSSRAAIEKATLAGQNRREIVNSRLFYPVGLTIEDNMLYWADNLYGRVERSELDGNYRETIVGHLSGPWSLSVYGNDLYILDKSSSSIFKTFKYGGGGLEVVVSGLPEMPLDIKVITNSSRTLCSSPCENNNGFCVNATCVPNGDTKSTCKCPGRYPGAVNDGRMCRVDNRQCQSGQFTCIYGKKPCISKRYTCDTDCDCEDCSDEDPTYCADHTCKMTEFTCANGRCIPARYYCDTDNDCRDNSDEPDDCPYPTCSPTELQCRNGKCIAKTSQCDGIDDCKDGNFTDEKNCHNVTCKDKYAPCRNGICIPRRKFCDGTAECQDKSDEDPTHCALHPCDKGDFPCKNHRCIAASWHCDEEDDCGDGSDEPDNCDSRTSTCFGSQFTCVESRDCIDMSWVCDGEGDCGDDSDESPLLCANHTCRADQFDCVSHRADGEPACIPRNRVCDGYKDCKKGEDENATFCPPPTCRPGFFRCVKDNKCIPQNFTCDHVKDCSDGSDEPQTCRYDPCNEPNFFKCADNSCIRMTMKCDATPDCPDGSDETKELCLSKSPPCLHPPHGFRCKNGTCIEYRSVCNDKSDCPDGEDEKLCGINECTDPRFNPNCEHTCKNDLIGYHCECNRGFTLRTDRKQCRDLDECNEVPGACTQLCYNMAGSYSCGCSKGYALQADKKTCKATGDFKPFILFANRFYIRKLAIDGSSYERIYEEHENAGPMDYDIEENRIYVVDVGKKAIMRMYMNGSNVEEVIKPTMVRQPEGITVDWIGRKIYWVDYYLESISVSELDGRNRQYLYRRTPFRTPAPRPVVAHPSQGFIYWADWSFNAFIARVGMDGTNAEKLVTRGVVWPNGLTIDFQTNKMWWADAHLDRIEFSNLDGTHRHVALANEPHPFALSIFEEWMYWADWNALRVNKANRFTGKNNSTLKLTIHRPMDIHVVHPLRQLPGKNPCEKDNLINGGCSHLCLIAPGGENFTCMCPQYHMMGPDGKTCVATCSDTQLYCGKNDSRCIPKTWKCDGEKDCRDGSDELNCPKVHGCDPGLIECPETGICIRRSALCDGKDDCKNTNKTDENNSTCSQKNCLPTEFRCRSGQCLPKAFACDGDADCSDKSDELPLNPECIEKPCNPGYFKCLNVTNKCIPESWVCDVDDDCGDGSDERQNCPSTGQQKCKVGHFACKTNYRCVPQYALCDGNNNCRDKTDELPEVCPACHPTGDFTCKNKRCIPKRWHCDHRDNCGDNSDEDLSICASIYRNCSESEFRCKNQKCIRRKFLCDHDNDCGDNSDEDQSHCDYHKCREDQFTCTSGHCVAIELKCDGNRDCQDMSDEQGCDPRYPGGRYCPIRKFECDNHVCVDRDWLCDGSDDCGDGSDETPQICKNITCNPPEKFQCSNLRCIPKYKTCNKVDDCGDGSDENDPALCPYARECKDDEFMCNNKKCISRVGVCDNKDDCGDASDEKLCIRNGIHNCSVPQNGGCDHNCTQLQDGYYCTCRKGYTAVTSKTCLDIDECAQSEENFCQQICVNIKGGYNCGCFDGFKRENDARRCTGEGGASLYLFAVGHEIRQYRASTKQYSDAVLNGRRISGLDIDIVNKRVYWTDSSLRKIFRAALPQNAKQVGTPQDLNVIGVSSPEGIAYDWVTENIYWTDSGTRSICVATSEGTYKKTLIQDAVMIPKAISVNPKLGMMYWTNRRHLGARIERASMNGENRMALINTRIRNPTGLAIDYYRNDRVYWSDTKENTIESCSFDGKDRTTIVSKGLTHPFAIDIFENEVLWVSQQDGKVWKMSKFGSVGGINTTVQTGLPRPNDIKVFQSKKYDTNIKNPCKRRGGAQDVCYPMCLLAPSDTDPGSIKASCVCPDGTSFIQGSDKACEIEVEPSKPAPKPCECINGNCIISKGRLLCICDPGWIGDKCDTHSNGSTPTPNPSTGSPTRGPPKPSTPVPSSGSSSSQPTVGAQTASGAATLYPTTKKPAQSPTTDNIPNSSSNQPAINAPFSQDKQISLAAILVPVLICVLLIIAILVIVIIFLRKRGTIGKRGHGKYRSGAPGDGVSPQSSAVMESSMDKDMTMLPEMETTQFSNPVYATVEHDDQTPNLEMTDIEKVDLNKNSTQS